MAEEEAAAAPPPPEDDVPPPAAVEEGGGGESGGGEAAPPPPANGDGAAGGGNPDDGVAAAAPEGPAPAEADPPAAAVAEGGGGGDAARPPGPGEDADLAAYFDDLRAAVRPPRHGDGAASASMGGGASSSAAMTLMLREGAARIISLGGTSGGHSFRVIDGAGGASSEGAHAGADADAVPSQRPPPALSPRRAGLYLCAVAQNIVALEAAVLGSRPAAAAAAYAEGGLVPGASTAKDAVEIVSAVSVAARFCSSRSIISQSGILPALSHLIESTGTVSPPPSALLGKSRNGKKGSSALTAGGFLHTLTPFHPEFLQCALLAGQHRYASDFLARRPASRTAVSFPYCDMDATAYLRTHYYAGLVHIACDDWQAALTSFHLCLAAPGSAVSAIAIAARKKSLLVKCLLLEVEELEGDKDRCRDGDGGANSEAQARGSGGDSARSALEKKVLELPGEANAAVNKYMSASSNRVAGGGGGSGSGPERTTVGGSETSEQQPGRGERRRRARGATSASSSDAGGESSRGGPSDGSKTKTFSHLGSYHDLVSTYISGNAANYANLLTEMHGLLGADGNWGLAKQLEGRLAYRAVRKVASVYSIVGVEKLEAKLTEVCSDLAGSSGGGEIGGKRGVEDLLMGMAARDAEDPLLVDPFVVGFDHSTDTVAFFDDCDESSDDEVDDGERQVEAEISMRLQNCLSLAERVRDLDIALTTSPKYQAQVAKEMMIRGEARASAAMKGQTGASVADIGHGPMDIGVDW
ncbi:hypothetical protein ACHAWF_007413 [Thalassiosira exigua]